MKKFAILAIAALVAGSAFAGATWIGDALIYADGGNGGTWYSTTDYSPDWVTGGAFSDLGEITSLSLGAQLQVYDPAGPSSWAGGGAGQWMNYRVDDGNWATFYMANTGNTAGNNNANMVMETSDENSQSFSWATATVDVSSYAGDGQTHKVEVSFGPIDEAPVTSTYSANFTVAASNVPEPATMSLLGLGALALVLRRKLRK